MRLALFDLDNTLLSGDSDFEWGEFLISKGVMDRDSHRERNRQFYEEYNAGTMDINAFLGYQLGNLAKYKRESLESWREEFIEKKIIPMISSKARSLVRTHQRDTRVLITATNSFITKPIADEFGIPVLIATEPETSDGEFTGLVKGIPSFREGKALKLNIWLEENNKKLSQYEESWFYSDSQNDIPLLSIVTHPVAVNPDAILMRHAIDHNWMVYNI